MKLIVIFICYSITLVLSLWSLYGPLRRALDPKHKKPFSTLLIMIVVAVLFAFPAVGAILPDGQRCYFFQRWGNVFLGWILYFFGPLFLIRLLSAPVFMIKRRGRRKKWKPARSLSVFLLISLFILSSVLNVWGAYTAHHVKVTRYSLEKEELNLKKPLRIALIGDLHIGVNSSVTLYEDMVERINTQKPDLVLVAGDIVTSAFGAVDDPSWYAEVLSGIKSTYGTYVVYGNHDVDEPLFGGFTYADPENALRNPAMPKFLKDCGWKLLTDETARIRGLDHLVLAGRRDEKRPGDGVKERMDLVSLLKDADSDDAVILLEHEPVDLDTMEDYGIGLVVCGHTHDGQVFPGNVWGRIHDPQSYGIKKWGKSTAVVTSGVGYYGPPIRVGTISEVVIIDYK